MAVTIRTYIDTGVLINAFRGLNGTSSTICLQALEDPHRQCLGSVYLQLELLPKPRFHKQKDEIEFMQAALSKFEMVRTSHRRLRMRGQKIADDYGLAAMDAIHIFMAIEGRAEEFLTTERPTKPICRVTEIKVTSLTE